MNKEEMSHKPKITDAKSQYDKLKKEQDHLTANFKEESDKDKQTIRKLPQECEDLLATLNSEKIVAKTELLQLTKEEEDMSQQLIQEVTSAKAEHKICNKEKDDLIRLSKDESIKSNKLKEKCNKLKTEIENLKIRYSTEAKKQQQNSDELKICKNENEKLKETLTEQTQKNLELENKLRGLEITRSKCLQCDEYKKKTVTLKKDNIKLQEKCRVTDELLWKADKQTHQFQVDINQLQSNITKCKQEVESLNTRIEILGKEKSELEASTRDKTNFIATETSLPDPDRPANLGRQFSELFEEEWSEALSELQGDNRQNIDYLRNIMTESYLFAKTSAHQYLHNLDNAILQINRSVQSFVSESQKHIECGPRVSRYIEKLVPLCFKMVLQEPPIVPHQQEDGHIDPACFEPYKEFSGEMNYVIWPALYWQEGGIVMCKGIAGGTN